MNNIVADVNLSALNLIARRLVKDHVTAVGGLESMTNTKELMASAHAARTRYQASLLEKQKVVTKESEKEAAGGKRELEKIKSLHKSADDFAEKADLGKIVLLTQSNSLKTAHEK